MKKTKHFLPGLSFITGQHNGNMAQVLPPKFSPLQYGVGVRVNLNCGSIYYS